MPRGNELPVLRRKVHYIFKFRGRSLDESRGAHVTGGHLSIIFRHRGYGHNRWNTLGNGLGIADGEALTGHSHRGQPLYTGRLRCYVNQVGAHAFQRRGNGFLRSPAHRHQGDNGADADDNTEHGQRGAELVGPQRPDGYNKGLNPLHDSSPRLY